jgi:LacI family transcriptional regulator
MPVKIKDIALKARVSPGTVSRALSGASGVGESKRERILNIARSLNYTPNTYASGLRTGKKTGFAVITPRGGYNSISMLRAQVMCEKASGLPGGARIKFKNPDMPVYRVLEETVSLNCKYIIINSLADQFDRECALLLKNSGTRVVFMDGFHKEFDSLRIFRENGTYQIARLLLLTGAENIIFMINESHEAPGNRLRGIKAAYESLGKPLSAIQIHPFKMRKGPEMFSSGYETARKILETKSPDALFCSNDEIAIGAMAAIRQKGLRIPDDIMVTGFDNIPEARFTAPPLTTAGQPVNEMTDAVMRICREENPAPEPEDIIFPANLILRESTLSGGPETRKLAFQNMTQKKTKNQGVQNE